MLLVHATIGQSRIHGLGLIAREPIPAGTTVCLLTPGFDLEFTEVQVAALPPPPRRTVLYHAIFDLQRRVFVLSGDDDRFTNHSDTPNTHYDGRRGVAVIDLAVGDEITCDYRELGWTEFLGLPPGSGAVGPRVPA